MSEPETSDGDHRPQVQPSRRHMLKSGGNLSLAVMATAAGSTCLSACSTSSARRGSRAASRAGNSLVRVETVITPDESGLLDVLLTDFEQQADYRTRVSFAEDVYGPARSGKADLVISHYGHKDVSSFVLDGFGEWPLMVFFNQLALIGPPSDPAHVRGLADLVQAYRQIAQTRSAYMVNAISELIYLDDILWAAAGQPPKDGWYIRQGLQKGAAIQAAAHKSAYIIWGVTPFLKFQQRNRIPLQPLLLADPILQRIMVATVVNPRKVAGVNYRGAKALQQYLLTPAAQARMRTFRVPGIDRELWWPAGRNNEDAFLA